MNENQDVVSPSEVPRKNKIWIALLLALIAPGLAQLYNGRTRRAILFLAFGLTAYTVASSRLVLWGGFPAFVILGLLSFGFTIFSVVDGVRGAKAPGEKRYRWFQLAGFWLAFILLYLPLVYFFACTKTFVVPAESMVPAIANGERIVVDLAAYDKEPPQRGDIAVFLFPKDESINYIKRVVGLPGDRILIKDKTLLLNGQKIQATPLSQPELAALLTDLNDRDSVSLFEEDLLGHKHPVFYLKSSMVNADFGEVTVPPGKYFVLGDHRDKSADSRFWGFVPEENFLGKASFIWFSRDPVSGRVRWSRIGQRIH